MKRTLLMVAFATIAFGNANADETINLGYTNGNAVAGSSTFASVGENEVSAAIYLPASVLGAYQGNSITSVRVGVAARNNLDGLTVWVRKSLDGENLAEGTTASVVRRWNNVALTTPYDIKGDDGLYIGYTASHYADASIVTSNDTIIANSFFLKANKETDWKDVMAYGRASIEAVVGGATLPAVDLQLITVQARLNPETGKVDMTATIRNNGTSDAQGFSLSWADAKNVVSGSQQFDDKVPSAGTAQVSFSAEAAESVHRVLGVTDDLNVTVTALDGSDAATGNNEQPALFTFQRKVLLEEYTGESCNNCPGAAELMEQAIEDERYADKVVAISRHWGYTNDSFTLQGDKDHDRQLVWYFAHDGLQGAPAFAIDRYPFFFEESVTGSYEVLQSTVYLSALQPEEFWRYFDERLQTPANAAFLLNATYDESTRRLDLTIEGSRSKLLNLTAPSHLTIVLTEDNVRAVKQYYTTSEWYDEYYHQHLYRWYNDLWGEEIDWNGRTFQKQLSVTLDEGWKPEDMHAVVYISAYDSTNPINMFVENADIIDIKSLMASGISTVAAPEGRGVLYNLQGQRVADGAKGLLIGNGKKYFAK